MAILMIVDMKPLHASCFETLRTEGLEGHALGLRKDADHIVVFITDGKANTKSVPGTA